MKYQRNFGISKVKKRQSGNTFNKKLNVENK